METESTWLAPVLSGDTLGRLLERHGMARDLFFVLNPDKVVLHTQDGVATTTLDEGEYVVVGATTGTPAEDAYSDMPPALRARYDECISYGGVFDPKMNQCCDPRVAEHTGACIDIFQSKRDEDRVAGVGAGAVVGLSVVALAVVGGIVWWARRPKSAA